MCYNFFMIKKAFIICGGFGTRLNLPFPKVLAKIRDKTLLEIQVNFLRNSCISDITLLTGFKNYFLKDYIKLLNLKEIITGTNGTNEAILKSNVSERSLFLYGDIYPDCSLSDFINSDTNKVCHLCVHKSSHPEDSDLICFKDNLLQSVIKKPHNFKDGFSSCCLFITDNRILNFLKDKDFMSSTLDNLKDNCSVYITDSKMLDCGTKERLKYANDKNSI